jgi:hypothetical protein
MSSMQPQQQHLSINVPQSDQKPGSEQPNQKPDEDLAYYESRRGQGWEDPNNMKILTEWIHYAAVYLDILSEATEGYRKTLRMNTIINLIISTLASTISVSTFNTSEQDSPRTALALRIIFTMLTFTLTIAAGYIKVYQIQEKLENSLRLKQEWALFGSKISSEMQLPKILRKNAIFLISTMKGTYLDLVKSDMGIKKDIIRRMADRSGLKEDDLTLSELFERIIKNEIYRLQDDVEEQDAMSPTMEKHLTTLAESYGLETPHIRRQSRTILEMKYDIEQLDKYYPHEAVSIPMDNYGIENAEQVAKIQRAAKELKMFRNAFSNNQDQDQDQSHSQTKPTNTIVPPSKNNDIVQGVKDFLTKITPGTTSADEKSQREDNAKQLLKDRGRVSSFLRSPRMTSRTQQVPRKSIITTQTSIVPSSSLIRIKECPNCRFQNRDLDVLKCEMCEYSLDQNYSIGSSAGSAGSARSAGRSPAASITASGANDDDHDEMSSVISAGL